MKRLKKECHHLHLKQKFSSWLLTFLFSSEKSEKPSWFLRFMKRDSCHSHISLHLNYSLKIKNYSLISLFDVAFKLKAAAPSSNVDGWIVGGGEISALTGGETLVSHARASGNVMGSGGNLPKAAHYCFLNTQLLLSGVVWRSLNSDLIRGKKKKKAQINGLNVATFLAERVILVVMKH